MTTTSQPKKPAAATAAASVKGATAGAANRATKTAFSAVESTRSSAENVVKIGGNAVKDLIASGSNEVQRAHEKMHELSRESANSIAKSADMLTKTMHEVATIYRDNVEACLECSSTMSGLAKSLSQEASDYVGKSFSDQVEISKDAFACRTFNDIMELQNKVLKQSMDSYFSQCMKICDLLFESTTEALEPINQRVSDATEQVSRMMAA